MQVGALRWHAHHWAGPGGRAPLALLLHGTGSGSFSFRHLAPLLAESFEVLAPDLPGHAFTRVPPTQPLSLEGVAGALADWLRHERRRPALLVGHSAGAAVALRLAMGLLPSVRMVVSINGALLPLQGSAGRLFGPTARLLALQPLVPALFAAWASLPGMTQRLLDGTGSRIDAIGRRCYAHLVSDPRHAAGALRLMASWDLEPLARALPGLERPLWLLSGLDDRMLSPSHARRVQALVPQATLVEWPGLGHLAHEEDAARVAAEVRRAWSEVGAARVAVD